MQSGAELPVRPVVEIDLGAIVANFRLVQALAPKAETAGVVKCDAYGLGAGPVAGALAEAGCRTFFVAYPDEGEALRRALPPSAAPARIFVFNGPDPHSLAQFRESNLSPILNSTEQARLWAEAGGGAPCALHIDTGMNRLGLPQAEVDAVAAQSGLTIGLVMSHLSCSSEPGHSENARQRQAFLRAAERFPGARRSLSASGGAMMSGDYHFDLVRPGAALYGVSPFDVADARLRPVARLTAPVVQTRRAAKGETVGYGAAVLDRDALLATVLLGYGDGAHRASAPRGEALLGGERCPILGRVSMDLIVLDATKARPLAIGDRAEFFGLDLPIDEAAARRGTIGYELLTGLGPRVLRRYVSGGRA